MIAGDISFEQALALSAEIVLAVASPGSDSGALEESIGRLVSSTPGARGFLVTMLTADDRAFDEPPDYVVRALGASPQVVFDLLVKNLVMSAGTGLQHEKAGRADLAAGSRTVLRRTEYLIKHVAGPEMARRLDDMWRALACADGPFADFIGRLAYADDQLEAARQALANLRSDL